MNSLILLSLAAFLYTLHELTVHGKIIFAYGKPSSSFWGINSWARKYKFGLKQSGVLFVPPINNWYYRTFNVMHKERWPTSSTLTVFATDAPHMLQWFYIKLFIAAIVTYREVYSWYWDGLILLGAWYLVWNITYQLFQRKK